MTFRWMPLSRHNARPRTREARPEQIRRRALFEHLEDRTLLSSSIPLSSSTWRPIGPAGIDTQNGKFGGFQGTGGPASGRIAGIAGDPVDPKTLYVAAAGGGVWKTTDAGVSWAPLTDNQATLFMGAIEVAPSNPSVIYAPTGEGTNSGDSFSGMGVLISTDAGATWTMTGTSVFNHATIRSVAIDSNDPKTAYVAVNNPGDGNPTGIYKTTDQGATWTNTTGSISTTDAFTAVVVDPINPLNLFAAVGTTFGSANNAVYKTTDGGNTWKIAGNFPAGAANGVITLAISATNPKEVVASVSGTNNDLKYLQQTTDAGATWNALASVPDYINVQGFYNNAVAISPTDQNVIFASGTVDYAKGGVRGIVETRDGGKTWTDLTIDSAGTEPHSDHHALTFDASGRLLEGNDGGIWRLDDPTPSSFKWSDINSNLQITEFEGNSLDPTNADVVYGGSQDNGTEKFTDNTTWRMIFGGDGGYTAVDPSNPSTVYFEYVNVNLFRTDNGGATFQQIDTNGINGNDPHNFYVDYTLDPSNPSHLLYGTDHIYTTTDKGASWSVLATPKKNGFNTNGAPVQWLAIAPSDPNTIYAATDDASVYVSTDAGVNWTQRNIPTVQDFIQQIVVDPADPKTAYAVRPAFNGGGGAGHVFETNNAGAAWRDISGNLPDLPAFSFATDVRPNKQRIYVGNDNGVFASTDDGATWSKFKTGLPNVEVRTLELNTNLDVLLAGTHGRGAFEIRASESINVLPTAPDATEGVPLSNVLVAQFSDSTGLKGTTSYRANVDFGDGTSTTGTVVDLMNGSYGVEVNKTYAEEGTFPLTVTVTSTAGSAGQGSVPVTVKDAALTPQPSQSLTTTEGARFSGVVGGFTDANPGATLDDFTATINWGDGHQTDGTVTPLGNGRFSVSGANTYSEEGSFQVVISVNDVGGSSTTVSASLTSQDAPLSSTGKAFRTTAGRAFTATIASFNDLGGLDLAADYTVTVDWGDGTPAVVLAPTALSPTSTAGVPGFNVIAGHTYPKFGVFQVNVLIADETPTTTTTAVSTATVADAAISATPVDFSATEGQLFSGQVATLTSTNPLASASDFQAPQIIWGDGTPTDSGTIVALPGGGFGVFGTHTYGDEGSYSVAVSVMSLGTSQARTTSAATISDAALTVTGAPLSGVAGQTITGTVATFSDAYALAPQADFTAQIAWGDGTTDTGNVTQPGGPGTQFFVSGSHAFARAQTYNVSVTVNDEGGATATAATTAVVSEPPITVSTVAIQPLIEGGAYGGPVGKVDTGNPLAVASDYLASINWGDGTSTGGQLTDSGNGVFVVSSITPHVYPEEGFFTATVSIVSQGGQNGSATTAVEVDDAPIVGQSGAPIQTVAGTTFSGVLGSFSESPTAPLSDFTATITLGDGQTSAGAVSKNSDGTYTVSGANLLFRAAGNTTATITVRDVGGSRGSFTVGVNASDPPISGVAVPISAVQGLPFSGLVATFTEPNQYVTAGEFQATINYGDGSAPQPGVVSGANGSFTVTGSHVYPNASASLPVTITLVHNGGSSTTINGSAHVLLPLSGGLLSASDTGVSNTDGITSNTRPLYKGRAEPGSTVTIFAAPVGNPGAAKQVGQGVSDPSGNFVIQIGPLGDGSYVTTASLSDPQTGATVQTETLLNGLSGGPLIIATTGPTVSSVSFDLRLGQLHVVFQTSAAGLNAAGAFNAGNYGLAQASRAGVVPLAATGLTASPGPNGLININISYGLGKRARFGAFVVMIHAGGLSDLAGNMLVEPRLVTFPQTTNSPNPDYVAQIDVSRGGAASAPHPYVSLSEQIAANSYTNTVQGRKSVRLPRAHRANLNFAGLPRPSGFRRRRVR